jgi:hypothetical protein
MPTAKYLCWRKMAHVSMHSRHRCLYGAVYAIGTGKEISWWNISVVGLSILSGAARNKNHLLFSGNAKRMINCIRISVEKDSRFNCPTKA